MNETKTTPKAFFLHLGSMVMLYVSAISFINLVFQTVNYAFPDQVDYYVDPYSSGIRWAIASLIIVFPLYLLLTWIIERDIREAPMRANFAIRKWLIYLTLFVAGLTVAIDLIVLINTFLGGEITTRFILKVLTILLVAGGVFGFFIYDLRRSDRTLPGKNKLFAVCTGIVIIAAIVFGFVIMGSPQAARDRQLDDQRISALQSIQSQTLFYWQQKGAMPHTLTDLNDSISGFNAPTQPSGSGYTYKLDSGTTFEICATFNRSNQNDTGGITSPVYDGGLGGNWKHPAGPFCFQRTIDPALYPVRANPTGSGSVPKVVPVPKYQP